MSASASRASCLVLPLYFILFLYFVLSLYFVECSILLCSHCCCCCGFDLCARLIVVKKWKSTAATATKGKINPAKAAAVKWWAAVRGSGSGSKERERKSGKNDRQQGGREGRGGRQSGQGRAARLCGRLMWLPSWLNFIFVACMPGFGLRGTGLDSKTSTYTAREAHRQRQSESDRETEREREWAWGVRSGMPDAVSATEPQSFGRFCIFSCSFAVWWFLAASDKRSTVWQVCCIKKIQNI